MLTQEQAHELVENWVQAWNSHDLEVDSKKLLAAGEAEHYAASPRWGSSKKLSISV